VRQKSAAEPIAVRFLSGVDQSRSAGPDLPSLRLRYNHSHKQDASPPTCEVRLALSATSDGEESGDAGHVDLAGFSGLR
jgi:hypothetical protein